MVLVVWLLLVEWFWWSYEWNLFYWLLMFYIDYWELFLVGLYIKLLCKESLVKYWWLVLWFLLIVDLRIKWDWG